MKKYKFSIDEPRPQVNVPDDFSKLLGRVKARIPWYAKTTFWGGTASVIVATVAGIWYVNESRNADLKHAENTVKTTEKIVKVPQPIIHTSASDKHSVQQEERYFIQPVITESEVVSEEIIAEPSAQLSLHIAEKSQNLNYTSSPSWLSRIFVKYDTLRIHVASLPAVYDIRGKCRISIAPGAIQHADGKGVSGSFILLYREITERQDMIAASVFMEQKEGNIPLENNGAFEIRLEQNGKALTINKTSPILVSFRVSDASAEYTGYSGSDKARVWNPMFIGIAGETGNKPANNLVQDRMMVKRSFSEWISDLFHGRSVRWDTFERVQYDLSDGSPDNKFRTFEVAAPGYFASAKPLKSGFSESREIVVSSSDNQILEPVLFQIFLNRNMVRKYDLNKGKATVMFNPDDHCILIAAVESSFYASVMDANRFDRLVKSSGTAETEVQLLLHRDMIKSTIDLQKLIQSSGKAAR